MNIDTFNLEDQIESAFNPKNEQAPVVARGLLGITESILRQDDIQLLAQLHEKITTDENLARYGMPPMDKLAETELTGSNFQFFYILNILRAVMQAKGRKPLLNGHFST